jgi:4-amino-4-deoxy-L-arabinose transferase-like glycosyltransferase
MLLVAALIAGLMMFASLGLLPLVQPDEGRNAEVAREMAASGAWLVPTFNGLPYLDKPALYFRMVAVSIQALGRSELAARLPSALFGFLLIAIVYLFCLREYKDRTAPLAALVLATTPLVFVFARSVIFDIVLTSFVTGAIFCGFVADRAPGRRSAAWYAAGAACAGLATLVKGPVGAILPFLVLAVFFWSEGRRRAVLALLRPLNLLVFFALVLPWFFALVQRHPDFLRYGLVNESIDRFTRPVLERARPVWYYVPVLIGGLFPWSLVLPESLVAWWRARAGLRRADRLFVAWAVVLFVFFSISRTKHRGYVLPVAIAAAVLVAGVFSRAMQNPAGRAARLVRRASAGLAACALVLAAVLTVEVRRPGLLGGATGLDAGDVAWLGGSLGRIIAVLGVTAFLAAAAFWRREPRLAFSAALVVPLSLVTILAGTMALYAEQRSHLALARRLEEVAGGAEIACLESFPAGAPFYLGRALTIVTRDGRPVRSNYIVQSLARTVSWPPGIVRFEEREAWLDSRRADVLLLADRSARRDLAELAGPRGAAAAEIVPGWWGAIVPPSGSRGENR